jgi:hypothetical protein
MWPLGEDTKRWGPPTQAIFPAGLIILADWPHVTPHKSCIIKYQNEGQ